MPRPKSGLRIDVEPVFIDKLIAQAEQVGLPLQDFLSFTLRQQAMGVASAVPVQKPAAAPRPPGRPVVAVDDVPPDAPRTAAGFVGVMQRGNRWFAKLDKTQLGPFSSAEAAALARYHHLKGYEHGLGQRLVDVGVAAPGTTVPAPYNSDLPAAPQPAAPGPQATDDLNLGACPGCRKLGSNGRLCASCIPLWATWSAQPKPEAPTVGSIIDLKGSPVEESFAEYVQRMTRQCGAPTGTHGREDCDNVRPCRLHGT